MKEMIPGRKYRISNLLNLKEHQNRHKGGWCNNSMSKYVGKVVTWRKISPSNANFGYIEEDAQQWVWDIRYLERLSTDKYKNILKRES